MLNKLTAMAVLTLGANIAYADECAINLEVSPSMQYSAKAITISKACKTVKLTLKNTSTFPKNVMGHNVVMSKKVDMAGVVADGLTAGLDRNYVKESDARVLAYTNVIGGGESTTTKIDVSKFKANASYVFYCSFPGHSGVMNGIVKVI